MSLIYRIKRLIKSDVHALLSGLEEPKLILEQSIRDMHAELMRCESNLQEAEATLKTALKMQSELCVGAQQIENKIEASLHQKQEESARFFIKKQIVSQKHAERLQQDILKLQEGILDLRRDLQCKQTSYAEILQKQDQLQWQEQIASPAFDWAKTGFVADAELEHEVELEWLKRLKSQQEAM